MHLSIHDLVLLTGLFLALIMAIAFGITSQKRKANLWFAGFLLASALVFMVKFMYSTGLVLEYPHWFKLNYPAGILRPVLSYLYILFLLDNKARFQRKHLLHFVPFLLLLGYLFPLFIQDGAHKYGVIMGTVSDEFGMIPSWFYLFQYGYSLTYLGLIFYIFRAFLIANPRPNRTKRVLIRWIKLILVSSAVFILIALFLRILDLETDFNLYMYDIYSILFMLLCIRLMTLPEIVSDPPYTASKYENSSLSETDIQLYFERIQTLMNQEGYFKNQDLKLSDISKSLSIPEHQISQIISASTGKTFRDLVNSLRIEEAKSILLDSHSKYSIEGIAQEAGFKSRASFYAVFKKHTGLTPSEFIKSTNQ